MNHILHPRLVSVFFFLNLISFSSFSLFRFSTFFLSKRDDRLLRSNFQKYL